MPYQEILLPVNARYYSFILKNKTYNSNHDIVWSFNYFLSNIDNAQAGLCTFLTPLSNNFNISDIQPGHYLGTALSGNKIISILSAGEVKTLSSFGVINVAFDSTGIYALSTITRDGLSASDIKQDTLIVRGCNGDVLLNQRLSSSGFVFNNANQIIQCLFSNVNQQLIVSYRNISSADFSTIASIQLPYRIINNENVDNLNVGLSFCSPVSTTSTSVSRMLLYSAAMDGVEKNTNILTISTQNLS